MNDELKEKLEEDLMCSICLERFKWPLTLSPCFHSYCRTCLEYYVPKYGESLNSATKIPCPDCRTIITLPPTGIDGLPHNRTLQSIIDNLALHEEHNNSKSELKEDKVEEAVATTSSSSSIEIDNNNDKTNESNNDTNNDTNQQNLTEEPAGTSINFGDTSFSPAASKVSNLTFSLYHNR